MDGRRFDDKQFIAYAKFLGPIIVGLTVGGAAWGVAMYRINESQQHDVSQQLNIDNHEKRIVVLETAFHIEFAEINKKLDDVRDNQRNIWKEMKQR